MARFMICFMSVDSKPVCPLHHFIGVGSGGETVAGKPLGSAGGGSKRGIAAAEAAAGGGAERDQRFAGEIIAFDKRTHDSRRFAPPDGIHGLIFTHEWCIIKEITI